MQWYLECETFDAAVNKNRVSGPVRLAISPLITETIATSQGGKVKDYSSLLGAFQGI